VVAAIPEGLASTGCHRRFDGGGRGYSKAMAYATIAGLPVQVGLYTAFLPMLIYAVLGTSRPLSVSTTTTIAILTGRSSRPSCPGWRSCGSDERFGHPDPVGRRILVLASCLRLGFVANFIPNPC